jgi:hypothetical protein
LLQRTRRARHQVVRQEHRERLVADDMAGAPDGMAKAERLLLPDRHQLAEMHARRAERIEALALFSHGRFELERRVEIVDQGRFPAAGDKDKLLDPGLARLVDRILDERPVDDREQLLGDRLGGGQQASAEARDRKHGLAKLLGH